MEYRYREIREDNDFKQREVAEKINMNRSGYANIEAEITYTKLQHFLDFCNLFNCSMDYAARLTNKNNTEHLITIDKIDKKVMAERLTILENETGSEAKDIAKELGVNQSTYSRYKNEKFKYYMQTLMVKRLAKDYGYSMDWLTGRSNIKKIK